MNILVRIAHLTTAHNRNDIRIRLKECNSLASHGYEVHYIVADGFGDDPSNNVYVHDIGIAGGRFKRMILRPWRMLFAALELNAKIYHFHDPEMLMIALFLKIKGAKVIYDSHEDVPRALMSRDWIPIWMRRPISSLFEWFENFISSKLSAIIGATPFIAERFSSINSNSVTINNYPLASEIHQLTDSNRIGKSVCYVGGIGRIRGIEQIVRALEHVDARLILAGTFENEKLQQEIQNLPGWSKVDYRGNVSREFVREILSRSRAGLVFFHPEPNHTDAQPNKMFEYMSAGLPVLASDFPLWKKIIVDDNIGMVADPMNPLEIARVIREILDNPQMADEMGCRGRSRVMDCYQWTYEERKLLELYKNLMG